MVGGVMSFEHVEDFLDTVYHTVNEWYDAHTNAYEWGISLRGSYHRFLKEKDGDIEFGSYTVSWKGAVIEWIIEGWEPFVKCEKCGVVFQMYGESICDRCNGDLTEDVTDADVYNYAYEQAENVSEEEAFDALLSFGFANYQDQVWPAVEQGLEDARAWLNEFPIDDPADQILHALKGAHLLHSSGRICEDYSIDAKEIYEICDSGLDAVFTKEQIKEFTERN
jgi:hypothetical protein